MTSVDQHQAIVELVLIKGRVGVTSGMLRISVPVAPWEETRKNIVQAERSIQKAVR